MLDTLAEHASKGLSRAGPGRGPVQAAHHAYFVTNPNMSSIDTDIHGDNRPTATFRCYVQILLEW